MNGPPTLSSQKASQANDLPARLIRSDRGRDPKLLKRKYKAMRDNAFAFYRGSVPRFYDMLPDHPVLRGAPAAWICGDLHLENIGTYKGDNRQVYFDICDFDQAALAPCTWDALRFAAGILVGAQSLGVKRTARLDMCRAYIDAYGDALASGKARWVERETATGLARELIESVRQRRRRDFLNEHTVASGSRRKLVIDGSRTLRLPAGTRKRITRFMKDFAAQQPDPKFFRPLAVARRIAGLGSLGLDRYVVLVRGKGSPDGNYLLELKEQPAPANRTRLRLRQPRWSSQAERIVVVQQRVQAIPPAFLQAARIDGKSFLVRELQPSSDKIYLARWGGNAARLRELFQTAGELTAWGQLRSSGAGGAATVDALSAFGRRSNWRDDLMELAAACAQRVLAEWKSFRVA